jgi:RecA-family ATPase
MKEIFITNPKTGESNLVSPPRETNQYKTIDNVYYQPSWDNTPPDLEPILQINGVPVLHYQNVGVLVALPGSGKSSICEAICSSLINSECDSFGIKAVGVNKILLIDGERSHKDVHNSFIRMMTRAGLNKGDNQNKVIIEAQVEQMDVNKRKERLLELIKRYRPELIILDGIGDFAELMNDEKESVTIARWLKSIASSHKTTFLMTVHPNEGDTDLKARGHVGRNFSRISECVLAITYDKSSGLRSITTDYANGKNRNGGKAHSYFIWSDEKRMMVSATPQTSKKLDPQVFLSNEQIDSLLFEAMGDVAIGYTELINKLKYYLERDYKERVNSGQNKLFNFKTWLEDGNFIKPIKGERYTKYRFNPDRVKQLTILDE